MEGTRRARARVGGASAAAGVGYQQGVTAWLAVHVLAEEQAPPLPSIEATVRVISTASETDQPIDDINARTNAALTLYVQAKRAVPQLVDRGGSDFTDFIEQAVDQHLALRSGGAVPSSRYVLATSPDASSSVRRELRLVLDRLRDAPRDTDIGSFGSSADRRAALTTTVSIIRRVLRERDEEPTDELVRQVLGRIVVWDLDIDGAGRSTGITLLAAAVVSSSTVAPEAWRVLEQRALKAAEDHETLDLHGWRRALQMDGVALRAIPSLEVDVGRMRAHSTRALADLERHRLLRVAGTELSVEREVTATAHRLVQNGPLLVVGDAGSGKSAVMADLARHLRQGGADVVVLDAEAVGSTSLGELSRELGLVHDTGEILDAWPGSGRGYLLVDGLDETRGSPGVPTLRRLVARVAASGSWVPVVAVRRFDLRYSSELRAIFAGTTAEADWTDQEFVDTRHVVVSDLSDLELERLRAPAPELVAMAHHPGVGPLLRRPIHLQLATDLLARGGAAADVARLRTQLQLLDLYWTRIVEEPVQRRASRELVLGVACRLVVADRRLTFARTGLDAADAGATTDLLGLGIVVEGEPQPGAGRPVRFLHGLVADYAIARLVLWPPGAVEALLVADPVNALFLRRSLELWLTALWESNAERDALWATAIELCSRDEVPEIAKLIAPTIAAESWTAIEDLAPLLAALGDGRRAPALVALRHLVASLTSPPHPPVAGADASPWSSVAVRLTSELAQDLVFPVRLLVMLLTEARAELTSPQLRDLGEAARRLLTWLWDNDNPDMVAARFAIGAVCASFASDRLAAEALLRRGLYRRHVERRGYEELRHYAEHIEDLEGTPGLVEALYTAAFAFDDASSGEPGVNLGGPVLSLVSDRGQEFRMVRYGLANAFSGLMQRNPEIATAALLRVLRASARVRHHGFHRGPYTKFTTQGVECRVRDKWSAQSVAWLATPDDEATLIACWSSGLATLAGARDPKLAGVIGAFLFANRSFAGWRVLIDAATGDDYLIATVVRVIASAAPVLSDALLRESLCGVARAARHWPELASELRTGLASPAVDADARASLLECLEASATPPPAGEDWDDGDGWLSTSEATVDEASPTRRILEGWCSAAPDDQVPVPTGVRTAFAELASSLALHDSAHEADWYLASRTGERLSAIDHDCHTEEGRLVATVLQRILESADSAGTAWNGDEPVESIPSHPCVLAAVEGLARLHRADLCEEVLPSTTVRAIADHPLPWARSQLARASGLFVTRDPDLAWSILDRLAGDAVARVAADAAWIAIRFRRLNPANARELLGRVTESHGMRSKVVGEAVISLAGLLVVDGVEELDRFASILEGADRMSDVASLLHSLRDAIMPAVAGDTEASRAHRAAMQLLRTVSALAMRRYEDSTRRWQEDTDAGARERALDAVRALDTVVSEVYFASGAFRGRDDEPHPNADQMTDLFDEIQGDLRDLVRYLPASAIHHVVEIAAANANARPTEAFLLIGDAVRAARAVGYETDSLAKDLVLGIVRTYLADRSGLFQGSTGSPRALQTALVTILDSFVAVGWPEARAMAYHLYEFLR
jgi:hypothetical protein